MKNYLCINGKKTELTKEQMKQLGIVEEPAVSLSKDGKIAKIGEYEFIVLRNDKSIGTVELLLKNSICNSAFGNNNDYRESKVRKIVEDFAFKIEDIIGEENLIEHNVDLVALSGLKDFGSIKSKMSLLTFDKARENIETLDKFKLSSYWWLATALSTKKHEIDYSVVCVSPDGGLGISNSGYSGFGVRPFCIVKSSIFQS